jgi:hypothetical protein
VQFDTKKLCDDARAALPPPPTPSPSAVFAHTEGRCVQVK